MKKAILLTVLAGAMPFTGMAQDDDLYFTPKKEVKTIKPQSVDVTASDYFVGSNRNVDEYNRYGRMSSSVSPLTGDSLGNDIINFTAGSGLYADTIYVDSSFVEKYLKENEDYRYTRRFSRWDGYYDPWFYNYYGYGPYYWRSSYWGWDPYYYRYGYYDPWYDPWYFGYTGWWNCWYDPWYYGYGYGPYYGRYYGWNPYYYGGGYVTYHEKSPNGVDAYAGSSTWATTRHHASNSGSTSRYSTGGALYGSGSGRNNTYTVYSNRNRSFGGRSNRSNSSYSNDSYSNRNEGFSTRSNSSYSSPSSSSGSYSGGSTRSSSSGSFGGTSSGRIGSGGGFHGRR